MIKLKKNQFYKLFQIKRIVIKRIGTISKGKINWMTILKTWRVRRENQWKEKKKKFLLPNLRSIDHKGCPMMNGTSKTSYKLESEFGCRASLEELDNTTYTLKCAMHAQLSFNNI
jgi:hypothetical protein